MRLTGGYATSTSGSAIGLRFHGYEARKGTSVCSHSFDDAGALLAIGQPGFREAVVGDIVGLDAESSQWIAAQEGWSRVYSSRRTWTGHFRGQISGEAAGAPPGRREAAPGHD
jgi:hypothetical protein